MFGIGIVDITIQFQFQMIVWVVLIHVDYLVIDYIVSIAILIYLWECL